MLNAIKFNRLILLSFVMLSPAGIMAFTTASYGIKTGQPVSVADAAIAKAIALLAWFWSEKALAFSRYSTLIFSVTPMKA